MTKANVCYLHKQDTNKWTWFLADEYGRSLINSLSEYDTYEEAAKDHNEHGDTLRGHLVMVEPNKA